VIIGRDKRGILIAMATIFVRVVGQFLSKENVGISVNAQIAEKS